MRGGIFIESAQTVGLDFAKGTKSKSHRENPKVPSPDVRFNCRKQQWGNFPINIACTLDQRKPIIPKSSLKIINISRNWDLKDK